MQREKLKNLIRDFSLEKLKFLLIVWLNRGKIEIYNLIIKI